MTTLPIEYNLFDAAYSNDIPAEQLFVHHFDVIPSRYNDGSKYNDGVLKIVSDLNFEILCEVVVKPRKFERLSSTTLYVQKDARQFIIIKSYMDDETRTFEFSFLYDIVNGTHEKQFDFKLLDTVRIPKLKSGISLVKLEMGHLDSEEYEITVPDINLTLNYGVEFSKIHNVIVERLNKRDDKGIVLFHGEPGTGKTSYIKYLASLIKDKEILFIPPSMAESISDPSFIPFLMERRNSILIIEDAEKVISDRDGNGSSIGVSNILNLTDGILGDCLNIQIIATFNMKRERIDSALLRKGRLIAEHKFDKLSVDDTNTLLKSIGKDYKVDKPMVLADIYNIDEEVFKTQNKNNIGFNN